MARRSLRPQLNQIRTWVQQGRTDAWIAHQLEVTVQDIDAFKRSNGLTAGEAADNGADFDDEIDLRAQDDELIAAELEKAEEERRKREEEEAAKKAAAKADAGDDEDDDDKPRRARSRRGGRGRRKKAEPLEGSFDHGEEEGFGLWLDPAVADNPVYAEHWAGHRPVVVTIEADQIVIRRAGEDEAEDDEG